MPDFITLEPSPAPGKKAYVAKLTGTHPQFKYNREFVDGYDVYEPGVYEVPVDNDKEYYIIAEGADNVGLKSLKLSWRDVGKYVVPEWLEALEAGEVTMIYNSNTTLWMPQRSVQQSVVSAEPQLTDEMKQMLSDAKELAEASDKLVRFVRMTCSAGDPEFYRMLEDCERLITDVRMIKFEDEIDEDVYEDDSTERPQTISGFEDLDEIPW